jgi:hypothetical protein
MAKWFAAILILVVFMPEAWTQATPSGSTAGSAIASSSGVVHFVLDPSPGGKKPSVSVNLEGPMIRIAAAAAADAAPPLRELLEQIELVQVQVYEDLQQDATAILQTASKKIEELKQQGWTTVVSVPDKGESVDVLTRTSEDAILGLVVLVADENELVFVNLAGEIDPEGLGKMIGQFKDGILEGDFDFEDLLKLNQAINDDDDDDDVKDELKEKLKDKDKDKEKEENKEESKPEAESSPNP